MSDHKDKDTVFFKLRCTKFFLNLPNIFSKNLAVVLNNIIFWPTKLIVQVLLVSKFLILSLHFYIFTHNVNGYSWIHIFWALFVVTYLLVFKPGFSRTSFCCSIKSIRDMINLDDVKAGEIMGDIVISLAKTNIMLDWLTFYLI